MSAISSLFNTAAIATTTQAVTGNAEASATAAGYSAWIESVTGRAPTIRRIGEENRVELLMDKAQILAMRSWLNSQVGSVLSKGEPPLVDSHLGEALTPWALQYAAPLIIGSLLAGWIAHWALSK